VAELTPFGYRPGGSLLHRLDVRFKLACLILTSIAGMQATFQGLGLLSLVLLWLCVHVRMSWRALLREARYFALLLAVVWLSRALVTPGNPVLRFHDIVVTREGMADGALMCWRLAGVVAAGLLFVHTTRSAQIRSAVVRILDPVPLIPARRVGTMIALLIRFIPVILNQARETSDVLKARGLESRRNPAARLSVTALTLLRNVFRDADRLVVAMEARCYSENRTIPELISGGRDWAVLAATVLLALSMGVA
jgi:energy-coupling factor transporter transmembrane protein EcfT